MGLPVWNATTTVTSTTVEASWSVNHTAAGTNRLAVVVAHFQRSTAGGIAVTSATYGGAAMTERANIEWRETGQGRTWRTVVYTFLAPSTSSTAVAITTDNNSQATVIAVSSYTNVDQTTPYHANGTAQVNNSSAATVNVVTTVTDTMIVGGCVLQGGDTQPMTPGTGVTERYDEESGINATAGHRRGGWGTPRRYGQYLRVCVYRRRGRLWHYRRYCDSGHCVGWSGHLIRHGRGRQPRPRQPLRWPGRFPGPARPRRGRRLHWRARFRCRVRPRPRVGRRRRWPWGTKSRSRLQWRRVGTMRINRQQAVSSLLVVLL
jgi:hypothetical protein